MAKISPGDSVRARVVDLSAQPRLAPPRTAVILAAGRSERLSAVTGGGSKALVRLGGMALVERQVRRLLALGMERVIVVVGYHAGPVAAVARRVAPGKVATVVAPDWEEGNGASLSAVEGSLEGEEAFLLVTADHLFSEEALRPLLSGPGPAVLVDPDPDPEVWEEATRVEVDGTGHVARLGKDVDSATAECGAFVLGGEVFEASRRARAAGDGTLSGAVSRLQGIEAVPIPASEWWQDIDTPADLRRARSFLRRSLRRASDGPVARILNRRLSVPLSWLLSPLRPSPDLISVLALGLGLGAAAALAAGSGLLGALLAQACSVLDGVDGEVARLGVRAKPQGAALDGFLDRLGDAAVAAGLGIWAASSGTRPAAAVVLTSAAVAGAMLSMATKDRLSAHGLRGPSERALGWLFGGRDARLLTVAVLAVAGEPAIALGVTAATSLTASAIRSTFARPAEGV